MRFIGICNKIVFDSGTVSVLSARPQRSAVTDFTHLCPHLHSLSQVWLSSLCSGTVSNRNCCYPATVTIFTHHRSYLKNLKKLSFFGSL